MRKKIMNRYSWSVMVLGISLLIALLTYSIHNNIVDYDVIKTAVLRQTAQRTVYVGFWTEGLWNNNTQTLHPEKLTALEKRINKKVAIAHYFRGWHHLDEPAIADELALLSSYGWRPMISINPYFFERCNGNGKTLYRAIADGACEEFVDDVAAILNSVDHPVFIRFAWEMNVPTMEWSVAHTGSTPQDFTDAWRYMYTHIEGEGNDNLIWVFSPQVESPATTDIALLYPGDDYVDWVALDGYNWGTTQSWSSWESFSSIFYASYHKLHRIAPGKNFMIAEVNATNVGGNRNQWYQDMLSKELPYKFPEVDAVVFFNEDKTHVEGVNWLIEDSPAFSEGIQNEIYQSSFER